MSQQALPVLNLCMITDGKDGHYTQLLGLQSALETYFEVRPERVEVAVGFCGCLRAIKEWSRQFTGQNTLLVGVGSETWRYLVIAKKIFALRTLVLLRPRLWPLSWFDQIVVPKHDELKEGGNILCTEGVLNPMRPSQHQDKNLGLILVGGPSKHYHWDDNELIKQVQGLVSSQPDTQWLLATSRRTPLNFLSVLKTRSAANLQVFPVEETPKSWLVEKLPQATTVWVTEDSMSMVFEGLSVGATVGLLKVPRIRTGRVTRCIDELINKQWLTPIEYYEKTNAMFPSVGPLQEATRIASLLAPMLMADQ